ncbi:MAG: formyltransferase family protein [Oligoflexales bacterium]
MTSPKRIVVAVSGGGRSLANLLKYQAEGDFEVVGIISSNAACKAVDIGIEANLPIFVAAFDSKAVNLVSSLQVWMAGLQPDLCVLAGFVRLFPLQTVSCPVINIHPALLPKYGGKGMYGQKVHDAVYKNKDAVTGATVHFVNERYDEGAIIAQIEVAVATCRNADEIQSKVFRAECEILPHTIKELLKGKLPLTGGKIFRRTYEEKR